MIHKCFQRGAKRYFEVQMFYVVRKYCLCCDQHCVVNRRCFNRLLLKHVFKVCNFIKNETAGQVLSCEFCKILKSTFFTEHFLATTSTKSFKQIR